MRAEAQADGTPESASSTENEELTKPFSRGGGGGGEVKEESTNELTYPLSEE